MRDRVTRSGTGGFYQKVTDIFAQCSVDYAELQAKRHRLMKMVEWAEKLDAFLRFNDYDVLNNPGQVSAEVAKALVGEQYDRFRVVQDQTWRSDFDALVERAEGLEQEDDGE